MWRVLLLIAILTGVLSIIRCTNPESDDEPCVDDDFGTDELSGIIAETQMIFQIIRKTEQCHLKRYTYFYGDRHTVN
jgi:hypothetical protein